MDNMFLDAREVKTQQKKRSKQHTHVPHAVEVAGRKKNLGAKIREGKEHGGWGEGGERWSRATKKGTRKLLKGTMSESRTRKKIGQPDRLLAPISDGTVERLGDGSE